MDDDFGGVVALLLLPFALLGAVLMLAYAVGLVLVVFGTPIVLGIAVNCGLRACVNWSKWWEIDEGLAWLLIALLGVVAVVAGVVALVALYIGLEYPDSVWLVALPYGYLLWLAGYIWAWRNPRFERSKGDVLMAKTLIRAWHTYTMQRQLRTLRGRVSQKSEPIVGSEEVRTPVIRIGT
jgi:hypothetical protein